MVLITWMLPASATSSMVPSVITGLSSTNLRSFRDLVPSHSPAATSSASGGEHVLSSAQGVMRNEEGAGLRSF